LSSLSISALASAVAFSMACSRLRVLGFKRSVCLVVLPNHSCRGMQRHAGRHLAGCDVAPQRDQ
jgi:hypothetical protein